MDETKIIVTHRGALEAKYGEAVSRVMKAVGGLIAADAERGIVSRLVALDSAADMEPFGAAPMGGPADREGAKRAIDAIDRKRKPHYLLILGSWDVVPMQSLQNVMGSLFFAPGGDPDEQVPSDLPYACDTGFSSSPDVFQGPTRVVGRLPDEPGARSPAYLVKVLKLAAQAKPLPREAYDDWLGLTAATWKKSSRLTARAVFGGSSRLLAAPPQSDKWSRAKLAPRVHFINCHGDPCEPLFRGELPGSQLRKARKRDPKADGKPPAISSASLAGRVTPGTVVAAECCFGAEVYDPKGPKAKPRGQRAMALQYLKEGAYGFFGSTTTAYGMPEGNSWGDLICRHFLKRVLAGASLGRAALMARHDFIGRRGLDDPIQLKTLAQFCLLGDPSIHPVARKSRRPDARPSVDSRRFERMRRQRAREALRATGAALAALERRLHVSWDVPDAMLQAIVKAAQAVGLDAKLARLVTMGAGVAAVAQGEHGPVEAQDAVQALVLVGRIEARDMIPTYAAFLSEMKNGRLQPPKVGFSK